MIIKCKICGGNLIPTTNRSMGTCESCGSTMTFPKDAGVEIANLYNRANHYRMECEFDKAIQIYEEILKKDINDPEAYWGLVIAKYGIEYVEDPQTKIKMPTCHRLEDSLITADRDFLQAVRNAVDEESAEYYRNQGKIISEIQKNILQIEEKFDVFISYKDSDPEHGGRTQDSVDAQEIYYALTKEGIKVFFSRITLEKCSGIKYEPFILAALRSAKVMLVVGSKVEYLTSEWVRNEWRRFYYLSKKDPTRKLIPCYKNIDPYDLPNQLAGLQAVDMRKIGFMQDLIHGIKKIIDKPIEKSAPVVASIDYTQVSQSALKTEAENLLKRARSNIKDGDYDTAKEYYTRSLDKNPESFEAYLGLFLCDARITSEEYILRNSKITSKVLLENRNYKNALELATLQEKSRLNNYIETKRYEEGRHHDLSRIEAIAKFKRNIANLNELIEYEKELLSLSKYPQAVELLAEFSEIKNVVLSLYKYQIIDSDSPIQQFANQTVELRIERDKVCQKLIKLNNESGSLESKYVKMNFLFINKKKEILEKLKEKAQEINKLQCELKNIYDKMLEPTCVITKYINDCGFNQLFRNIVIALETKKVSGDTSLKVNGTVFMREIQLEKMVFPYGAKDISSNEDFIYVVDLAGRLIRIDKKTLHYKEIDSGDIAKIESTESEFITINNQGNVTLKDSRGEVISPPKKIRNMKFKAVFGYQNGFVMINENNELRSTRKIKGLKKIKNVVNMIMSDCIISVTTGDGEHKLLFTGQYISRNKRRVLRKAKKYYVNISQLINEYNHYYYVKNTGEFFKNYSSTPLMKNVLMISTKPGKSTFGRSEQLVSVLDYYGKEKRF